MVNPHLKNRGAGKRPARAVSGVIRNNRLSTRIGAVSGGPIANDHHKGNTFDVCCRVAIAERWLDAGADLTSRRTSRFHPISMAVATGNADAVTALFSIRPDFTF